MGSKADFKGKKTWENYYWFYYKWHYIAIISLIIMIAVCTAQCLSRVNPDMLILFNSDEVLTDNILDELSGEVEKKAEDKNGDGEIHIQAINCTYSEASPAVKNSARQQSMLQLQSKDVVIWILDKKAAEIYYEGENIDIFASSPSLPAYEGHALPLKNTVLSDILAEYDYSNELFIFCRKGKNEKETQSNLKLIGKLIKTN